MSMDDEVRPSQSVVSKEESVMKAGRGRERSRKGGELDEVMCADYYMCAGDVSLAMMDEGEASE